MRDVQLAPAGWTTWHITWGTYGARLHGDGRPTVNRSHNTIGEAFIETDDERAERERARLRGTAVYLAHQERVFIEATLPALCERGGWTLRECAGGPDHVHVLCDIKCETHGKSVRRWLKTWVTQSLGESFALPTAGKWWAEAGSTRAVKDIEYLRNVTDYVWRQRATNPT
jgi:REP element-mobilizing transposase RayT